MGKFKQNKRNTMDVHILYLFSLVYSSYVMLVLHLSPHLLSNFPRGAHNCQFLLGRYKLLGNFSVLPTESGGQLFKD